jgi:hypothetical protein
VWISVGRSSSIRNLVKADWVLAGREAADAIDPVEDLVDALMADRHFAYERVL